MHKHVFPLLLVLVIIIVGGVYLGMNRPAQDNEAPAQIEQSATTTTLREESLPPETTTAEAGDVAPSPDAYTPAEVAVHSGAASCWTSINGNVYDLTAWIAEHPGGQGAILRLCGADGTVAFSAKHGGQGRPEAELASFKIGTLSN